jgi:DHA2 family methylenomycin A resistance protein-like MFS transporter
MCVGMFLVQLDVTVVHVALPTIRTDLHTSLAAFVDGLHVLGVGGCLLWLLAIGLTWLTIGRGRAA